jgi:sugar/nucleoside kinase (ribokinase family)
MKVICVGEVCREQYLGIENCETNFLGGCALNQALQYVKNGQFETTLAVPIGDDSWSVAAMNILNQINGLTITPQRFSGRLPVQKIEVKKGLKHFVEFAPGVLDQFLPIATDAYNVLVTSVYSQYLSVFEGLLKSKRAQRVLVDFFDLMDFNQDIEFLKAYAAKIDCFQLGLDLKKHSNLIEDISKFAYDERQHIVVTLAENGVIIFEGRKINHFKHLKAIEPVDSTGAGDCFIANYFSEWLMGSNHENAVNMAHKRTLEVLRHFGGNGHAFRNGDRQK